MFAWHACWLIHCDSFRFLLHVERNRNGVPRWKTLFTNVASACPAWSLGLFVLHYMAGNRSWLGLAHVLPLPEDSQVQSSWLLHSIHTLRALSVRPPASCYFSCRGYNSPNGVRHLSLISTKLNEKMTSLLHFITRDIMITVISMWIMWFFFLSIFFVIWTTARGLIFKVSWIFSMYEEKVNLRQHLFSFSHVIHLDVCVTKW